MFSRNHFAPNLIWCKTVKLWHSPAIMVQSQTVTSYLYGHWPPVIACHIISMTQRLIFPQRWLNPDLQMLLVGGRDRADVIDLWPSVRFGVKVLQKLFFVCFSTPWFWGGKKRITNREEKEIGGRNEKIYWLRKKVPLTIIFAFATCYK